MTTFKTRALNAAGTGLLTLLAFAGSLAEAGAQAVDLASEKGVVGVCRNGAGIPFSEEKASEVLSADEIYINIDLMQGEAEAKAWGCDLTYDYVKINGDYRS